MQGAFSGGENEKLVGIVRRRCNFHACVDSKRKQLYPRLWLDGYGVPTHGRRIAYPAVDMFRFFIQTK